MLSPVVGIYIQLCVTAKAVKVQSARPTLSCLSNMHEHIYFSHVRIMSFFSFCRPLIYQFMGSTVGLICMHEDEEKEAQ